jgi:hypothetical protein
MSDKGFHLGAEILDKKDVDYDGPYGHVVREYTMPACKVYICDDAYRGKTEKELEEVRKYAQQVAYGILVNSEKRKQAPEESSHETK